MKGIIFVQLLKMAEDAFGEDTVDEVLDKADLQNGGVFTAVGNYPCEELVKMVMAFSDHSGLPPEALQRKFGHWMLGFFVQHYPDFFADKQTAFDMLESIDSEIHVEVRKLYPDAELPRFDTERLGMDALAMTYTSPRPLVAFCHGLIEACVDHFDEQAQIAHGSTDAITNSTRFEIRTG